MKKKILTLQKQWCGNYFLLGREPRHLSLQIPNTLKVRSAPVVLFPLLINVLCQIPSMTTTVFEVMLGCQHKWCEQQFICHLTPWEKQLTLPERTALSCIVIKVQKVLLCSQILYIERPCSSGTSFTKHEGNKANNHL